IIGGEPSGVTEGTTNVLLECALFDTRSTAATGRKLAIESDARYRFERGVDPGGVMGGIEAGDRPLRKPARGRAGPGGGCRPHTRLAAHAGLPAGAFASARRLEPAGSGSRCDP